MNYKICLPLLVLPILLVACNQKKDETQTMDAATGKGTEIAKEVTAVAGDVESQGAEKPKNQEASAEEKKEEKPGDGFVKTAKQYQEKSNAARDAGDNEKADIYSKLAEIKMEAATAVNEGKGYDWTHYHELVKQLDK